MTQASEITPAEMAALARRIDRPVVLVGLMGSGKSTVGRRVATMLETDFVDSDEEIEHAAQMSVSEIFNDFGEEYFRDGERRVIARLIEEGHGVIATGGGAFIDPETRALILSNAIAVWLDCDIDILVQRTGKRNDRPLLAQGNPREILTNLSKIRNPIYGEAQVRVETGIAPHHRTALSILEAIDRWL
ncbi:shikimate kinase [Porphyrobacter algicida]|uniref:Shikimate kinase n=1 Tax=Qipengyuania algicida TaxID=1836209 RepID=A0A845AIE7_9SPHN|nr:shikimate kinase [Qipengyuania algicida]MXP29217.1 shikimate kinase [Qipengyuania algicida]